MVTGMDINITQIKKFEGKVIPIDCEIDIALTEADDFKLVSPIKVSGSIKNFGGTLELRADGECSLKFVCDRCAEDFEVENKFKIIEDFKEIEYLNSDSSDEFEDKNPDITYFSGDTLNLDEFIYSSLVLSLPGKHLCADDCKGLCVKCGANLNKGSCSCDTRPVDPRFDVLDSLNLNE